MVSWDQVSGIVDRVVLVGLTYAVSKGFITPTEVAGYSTMIVTVIGAVWGWWVNRPKAIAQAAAALPNTTVVTTPELAAATPERNIVSNADAKVVNR